MPYFTDYGALKKDDEENQPQISGASPTTEKDGTGADPSGSAGTQTKSGFTNIDKYLNANDATGFGKQFVGNVQGEIDEARGSQSTAGEGFKQRSSTSNALPTETDVNSAIANPTAADPTQFQKWITEKYSGPRSLGDTQDLYNQYWGGVQKAKTSTDLLGSEGGRFSLLDSYFGRPKYNFGEKSLDNLLVQHSGAQNQQRGLQEQAAQLKTAGNEQEKDLQNFASQRSAAVDASRGKTRAAIGVDDAGNIIRGEKAGAIGKEIGAIDDAVAMKNDERKMQYDDIERNLKSGQLTPEQMAQYGLHSGLDIFDLDLAGSRFLQKGEDLNQDHLLTDDQRKKIRALEGLAGITDTYAAGTSKAVSDPFRVFGDQINAAAQARGGEYLNEIKSTPMNVPGLEKVLSPERNNISGWIDFRDKVVDYANGVRRPNKEGEISSAARYVPYLGVINAAIESAQNKVKQKYNVGRTLGQASAPVGGMIGHNYGGQQ